MKSNFVKIGDKYKSIKCKKCGGKPYRPDDGFGCYLNIIACKNCGEQTDVHNNGIRFAKYQWVAINQTQTIKI